MTIHALPQGNIHQWGTVNLDKQQGCVDRQILTSLLPSLPANKYQPVYNQQSDRIYRLWSAISFSTAAANRRTCL